jgi:galactose mutarotase-like enzyme
MSKDQHTIVGDGVTATILAHGAELCSLKTAAGLELMWQAGDVWPRHAPLLFPIVGKLKNDTLRHRGKSYPMTQHGFARDSRFEWVERGRSSCRLVLEDNAQTRAHYPFAFRLAVTYALEGGDLDVSLEISNPGDEVLPASIGGHPAFNWPLKPGLSKTSYRLVFAKEESSPIRRLKDGLLRLQSEPSPIRDRELVLSETLFEDDAVILDKPASTSLSFTAGEGPSLEVSWEAFRELGIWSKPEGAPFLCIEPWRGFASPSEFDGEFVDKPGLMHIGLNETQRLSYRIGVR